MMKLRKVIAVFVTVLLITVTAWAVPSKDIFNKVLKYYQALQKIDMPKGSKAYYFDMTQTATPRYDNEGVSPSNNTICILSGTLRIIKTSDVEIYQDSTETFVVVKQQKKIFYTKSKAERVDDKSREVLRMIPYEMIASSEIVSCVPEGSKDLYRIQLALNKEYSEATNIKTLTFWVNNVTNKVTKAEAKYNYPFELEKLSVNYNVLNFNYKVPYSRARSYIYRNNKLVEQFKDYQIIYE